jgi:hypothetical protein
MKKIILFAATFSFYIVTNAQNVGIGTSAPNTSAVLDITSVNKGLLIPRMRDDSMLAITNPQKGLLVYDSTYNLLFSNIGTPASPNWIPILNLKFGWATVGNDGTNPLQNYLGTSDNQPLIIKTSGNERMRIDNSGKAGIGTNNPQALLHLNSSSNEVLRLQANFPLLNFYAGSNLHSSLWANASNLDISTGFGTNNGITFSPNATQQVTITYNGDIGIGIASPLAKVHVNSLANNEALRLQANNFPLISLYSGNNQHSQIWANGSNLDISTSLGTGRGISFSPNAAVKMLIDYNGNVGIGTTAPTAKMQIDYNSSLSVPHLLLNEVDNDYARLRFQNTINTGRYWDVAGYIGGSVANDRLNFYNSSFGNVMSVTGDGVLTMQKTGGLTTIEITPEEIAGEGAQISLFNRDIVKTIEIDADYGVNKRGRIILDEIQIKGGSDLAEHFDITKTKEETVLPGMLVSIDEKNEGSLCLSNKKMDTKIAGVISGANGIQPGMMMGQSGTIAYGDYPVALAGRVYVLANEEGGKISPGDFITSSSVKGYGMKVKNIAAAQGAIIGKAMSKRDATTGYVLVLINLQ